ncbi:MAG: DUF4833 domain-containing protein [Aestuariivirga sp.]|uniref:DUF4833 domain-containing protein n=1 Tax=Aestuariivirga sp. TaxID=2650926 RepID=UPI0038CFC41B
MTYGNGILRNSILLALLVPLVAAAFLPAARASHVTGFNSYPAPHEENQIFFVQRSMNPNTAVYTARLDDKGMLDQKRPVDVFWRRYNDEGEKQKLSFLERTAAFGVTVERVRNQKSAFRVSIVSYPQRPVLLTLIDGRPRLVGQVAGEPAELIAAYLHLDESGSIPSVTRVDLVGRSLASSKELRESFVP